MTSLIALFLISNANPESLPVPYLVSHCYSSDSEFNPRVIKILEVGHSEYRYSLFTQDEFYGNMSNSIDTINSVYPKEVVCEKK